MGKPTHGYRRQGYLERLGDYLAHGEEVPRGQVRPEHGGSSEKGMMTPDEVLNKIAKGTDADFTPDERSLARNLLERF